MVILSNRSPRPAARDRARRPLVQPLEDRRLLSAVGVAIHDAIGHEGTSRTRNLAFDVSLDRAAALPITVSYATSNGSARAASLLFPAIPGSSYDYLATRGTLTFAPGMTTQLINVAILADGTAEPDETFLVHLTSASNAAIADGQATGTIVDGSNSRPTIGSLTAGPNPVIAEGPLSLTAHSVADADGTVAGVAFYRESDGFPGLRTGPGGDLLVGTDSSSSGGWSLRVPTAGLAPGTYAYHALATDNLGAVSAFRPPTSVTVPRTLFLNFDGATIARSDLVRWAGTDWPGMVDGLDGDRNGIVVRPFLSARADREDIINRLLTLVRDDLSPFGIAVARRAGPAVEGVGATTIFLGQSTLTGGHRHVAGDIDYFNDNRTDIAFVGDEYGWGPSLNMALALADVTLHEAGHTYGLYHVDARQDGVLYPESMGLRYSTPDVSRWLADTSFMDRTFGEYLDHGGGRGPQNAYLTLARNFNPSPLAGPVPEPRFPADALRDGSLAAAVDRFVGEPLRRAGGAGRAGRGRTGMAVATGRPGTRVLDVDRPGDPAGRAIRPRDPGLAEDGQVARGWAAVPTGPVRRIAHRPFLPVPGQPPRRVGLA